MIDFLVEKLISFQKLESKSNEINLNIIFSSCILIVSNIIFIILINAKLGNNPFFDFGQFEDITPNWFDEMPEQLSSNILALITTNLLLMLVFFLLRFKKIVKCVFCFRFFFNKSPVMHFYEFFKLYAPEKDFQSFSIDIIYCISNINLLFMIPKTYLISVIFIIVYCLFSILEDNGNIIIFSYTFSFNKKYFKIIFAFTKVMLLLHFFIGIWWYSSEYFFIDIKQNIFNDFYTSDKNLIIKFIKGQSSISEKIKIKFPPKRNLWIYILFGIIVILELVEILYKCFHPKLKKHITKKENSLEYDEITKIKYYEYYRLLYCKICLLYLNNSDSLKEYKDFLEYKLKKFGGICINNDNFEEFVRIYNKMLETKKEMIKENKINITNYDFTFSPFLLDEYSFSFITKFILSPYNC